jgi:hypothetical protein
MSLAFTILGCGSSGGVGGCHMKSAAKSRSCFE